MVTSCFDEKTDAIVYDDHDHLGLPVMPQRPCNKQRGQQCKAEGPQGGEGATASGSHHGRDDRARNSPAKLLEPCRCAAEEEGDLECGAAAQEQLMLRDLLKRFVQDMLRGKAFLVVISSGRTEPCKLSLTSSLMCFQLEIGGTNHEIPLRNIKDVCPGELIGHHEAPIQLDELCNTLVLKNHECITFKFGNVQERDDFTKCVKVLAIALDV